MRHPTRVVPGVRARALAGFVLALTVWWSAACRIERAAAPGAEDLDAALQAQVEEILRLSAEAWNGGDLEGFMVHYQRAPTTTYLGSGGLRVGYDSIHARYAPAFEPGASRDSLRFESIRTRLLEQRFGIATARYVLYRDGVTTSTGPFTLVLMQVEGAWKIIHDQSAADPPPESGPGAESEESEAGGSTGSA